MKISFVGIEAHAVISEQELSDLLHKPLKGNMLCRDVGKNADRKKIVPIEINLDRSQIEILKESSYPEHRYLLDCKINFSISEDYYEELRNNGSYSGRFCQEGKLTIRVEGPEPTVDY